MTSEAIQAMPAGREMDTLVAENVMSWRQGHDELTCSCWFYDAEGQSVKQCGFSPSTDIAAAWQAVDSLSACGCGLVLEDWRHDPTAPGKWSALFTLPDGHDTVQAVADTASLAVCRAALLATRENA